MAFHKLCHLVKEIHFQRLKTATVGQLLCFFLNLTMRTVSSVIDGFSGCAGSFESDLNTESNRILKSDIEKKNLLSVICFCVSVSFFFLPPFVYLLFIWFFHFESIFLYQCHIGRLNYSRLSALGRMPHIFIFVCFIYFFCLFCGWFDGPAGSCWSLYFAAIKYI